jgi:glucose/arabinose dehydrogenase
VAQGAPLGAGVGRRAQAVLLTLALATSLVVVTGSAASAAPPRTTDNACPPADVPDPGFEDAAGPFAAQIACVAWYGVTQGRTATSFAPAGTVTRGQLASFTRSLLDAALPDGFPLGDGRTDFEDVVPTGPHAGAIDALAAADPPVLEGYDGRTFGPGDRVTRAQAASIVDRALRRVLPALEVAEDPTCDFGDRDRITPVHRTAVDRLCALGVAAGRDDGRFVPAAGITRGQAAAFLARALDVVATEGDLRPPWVVTTLVDDLDHPWEVVRTATGRTYVTERDRARLLEVAPDGTTEVVRTFEVDATGEGGLLGLAADPTNGDLLAYLSTASDNRIVRFDPNEGQDGALELVLNGIPRAATHVGGRIAFGPDGALYVGTGDAAPNDERNRPTALQLRAQDPGSLAGKILRIDAATGSAPAGNPLDNLVWSLGHRNVQGLAWDADDRLWAAELGPGRDDEVNLIVPGGDYGWPYVLGTETDGGQRLPAAFVRQPPEASWSGATFTTEAVGIAGPDTLLLAALRGQRLWRITTDGDRVTGADALFTGQFGRLRTVVPSGDGGVLVLTANGGGEDRLLRIGRPLP